MDIQVQSDSILHSPSELSVLALFEGAPLPADLAPLIVADDFAGSAKQTALLYPAQGGPLAPRRLLLIGLGKPESVTAEQVRQAGALAVQQARTLKAASFSFALPESSALSVEETAQAAAEGIELGAYRFWRYRTNLTDAQQFVVGSAVLFAADSAAARRGVAVGQAIARGVIFARDLVNSPGGITTPARLAEEAVELGIRAGLKVTVLDKAELTEGGYGGILAVGQGSANDPRFIIMEYGEAQEGKPTICLVGKGLTFDSGGLSIKPADGMDTMKSDMAGSAAVFGALQTAAELNLPLHIVGLVPSAENMPSSTSFRPGDILTTLSGKTIEVLNTDAEGRIILADALFYARRYNPAAIVELSTLTGAMVIALGPHATGLMATDPALENELRQAGDASGERVWPFPLWPEYHEMIKSEFADLKNIGGRPAGSITAGAFLAAFVGDFPFAHLDIAGTAWAASAAKPYDAPGATGVGVRLLTEYLKRQAQ